jgi:adenylylsulfate kinase-like enzyme
MLAFLGPRHKTSPTPEVPHLVRRAERDENLRRVAEAAALFADAGFVVLSAFISPLARERAFARSRFPSNFHEIYVKASLALRAA